MRGHVRESEEQENEREDTCSSGPRTLIEAAQAAAQAAAQTAARRWTARARESRPSVSTCCAGACAGAVQDSEYAPLNVEVSRQPVKAGPPEGGG
jgi:hypothetical protein